LSQCIARPLLSGEETTVILLRVTREIAPGKWDEYKALRDKVDARYEALGIETLSVKDYRPLFGGGTTNTAVGEVEWESLTSLDAAIAKLNSDPELQELRAEVSKIAKNVRREIYEAL
jgi:hypothetical protein